jgi:hypothetical protein
MSQDIVEGQEFLGAEMNFWVHWKQEINFWNVRVTTIFSSKALLQMILLVNWITYVLHSLVIVLQVCGQK